MYKGCFLQTRFLKILNVFVDQKTRLSICFKTRGRAFETLTRAFKIIGRAFETLGRAFKCLREN